MKLKRGFFRVERKIKFLEWHRGLDYKRSDGSKTTTVVLYLYPEQEMGRYIRGLLVIHLDWPVGKLLPKLTYFNSDCRADAYNL